MIPRQLRTGVRTFAALSKLKISYLWMDILVMDPYIRLFPHVSHLTVTYAALRDRHSSYPPHPAFGALGGARDTQNVRCINQSAQASGRSWKALEELDTDLPTAWVLGLSCKVKRLALYVPPDRDLRLLPEVLADVRPDVLELTLAGEEFLRCPVSVPPVLDALTVSLTTDKREIGFVKSCVVGGPPRCMTLPYADTDLHTGAHHAMLRIVGCKNLSAEARRLGRAERTIARRALQTARVVGRHGYQGLEPWHPVGDTHSERSRDGGAWTYLY